MTTTVRQLTIQIPEHAQPGSVLSIPVKGQQDTVKVRIPDGFSPGDVLVLTKEAGSEEWMVEAPADTIEENPDQAQHQLLTAEGLHDLSETEPFPTSATLPPEGPVLSQESPCPESESPSACTVRLDTTLGAIDIIVRPDWAPHGARRFLNLAAAGDLDDLAFYRVVKGCIAQFGLPTKRQWPPLPDDPPTGVPFLLGAVSLVADRKDARKSTLVICTGDMSHCFGQHAWETPIGAVAEYSLEALKRIESMYGDIAECGGRGPSATRIILDGNSYLQAQFPQLTYIRAAWPLDGLVHQEFNISTPPPIQDDRFAALESMVEQVETREQLVGPADDLHPAPSTGKIDQPVDERQSQTHGTTSLQLPSTQPSQQLPPSQLSSSAPREGPRSRPSQVRPATTTQQIDVPVETLRVEPNTRTGGVPHVRVSKEARLAHKLPDQQKPGLPPPGSSPSQVGCSAQAKPLTHSSGTAARVTRSISPLHTRSTSPMHTRSMSMLQQQHRQPTQWISNSYAPGFNNKMSSRAQSPPRCMLLGEPDASSRGQLIQRPSQATTWMSPHPRSSTISQQLELLPASNFTSPSSPCPPTRSPSSLTPPKSLSALSGSSLPRSSGSLTPPAGLTQFCNLRPPPPIQWPVC